MPQFCFSNIKITGIASAVPKKKVRSTVYNDRFGAETVARFIDMTGVAEHRQSERFQTASDLGYAAAEKLIEEKDIDRSEIDVILFGAHSTDYRRPATACVLHKRLGLKKDCAAYDIGLGCSAFVYCVTTAASILKCSDAKRALVIVGETMTKMINPEDQASAMLFGDAGAACLLEKEIGGGIS